MVAVGAAKLPITLPTDGTTAILFGTAQGTYTGTIPTEFGLLTEVTEMYLNANDLTGTIPTELGLARSGWSTRVSSKRGQTRC